MTASLRTEYYLLLMGGRVGGGGGMGKPAGLEDFNTEIS